jgi:hypothetical protein
MLGTATLICDTSLRLADGPDEVHLNLVARYELAPYTEDSR